MLSSPPDEVAIFEQIHALLEEQRQGKRRAAVGNPTGGILPRFETRSGRRRPYHCAQLLAPLKGRTSPAQTDFALVQCRDISPGGFSYFTESRPKSDKVVVALGLAPFSFFVAQIVRIHPPADGQEGPLLVGCKFLHRLEHATC